MCVCVGKGLSRMPSCHLCYGPLGDASFECAACWELPWVARVAWLHLEALLCDPPFQVWPRGGSRKRRKDLPVEQPGRVAQGSQQLFTVRACVAVMLVRCVPLPLLATRCLLPEVLAVYRRPG